MRMETLIPVRRRADRLPYPESGVIVAIVLLAYVNAALRLIFG